MTLNYQMMVERYPNLKEEVGGFNPGYEISSLLDRKLARWSTASCALVLACWPSISTQKKLHPQKYGPMTSSAISDPLGFHILLSFSLVNKCLAITWALTNVEFKLNATCVSVVTANSRTNKWRQ